MINFVFVLESYWRGVRFLLEWVVEESEKMIFELRGGRKIKFIFINFKLRLRVSCVLEKGLFLVNIFRFLRLSVGFKVGFFCGFFLVFSVEGNGLGVCF